MANTGFTLTGLGANNADAGNNAWTTPTNAQADDAAYANSAFTVVPQTSQYLHCTTFGFAVDAGATIDGIIVRVPRSQVIVGVHQIQDNNIILIKGGTRSGTDKADTATNWPTTDTNKDYGTATDLWGNTLTPADVNATNFGVAIRCKNSGDDDGTARVDAVWIDVNFTLGGAPAGVRRTLALMGAGR